MEPVQKHVPEGGLLAALFYWQDNAVICAGLISAPIEYTCEYIINNQPHKAAYVSILSRLCYFVNTIFNGVGVVVGDGFLVFLDKIVTFFETSNINGEMVARRFVKAEHLKWGGSTATL